ncbi:MAG: alpha-1,2-fucosyltransferase [Bacteroidota bacterium]
MIISRITGGLGNQLFQYAAGFSLAKRKQVEYKLHFSLDQRDTHRKAEISHLLPEVNWCTNDEAAQFIPGSLVKRMILRFTPTQQKRFIKERHFHFDNQVQHAGSSVYIKGYWQSEYYFSDACNEIRAVLLKGLSRFPLSESLMFALKGESTVSLHVRKGDYLKPPYSTFYAQLNNDYYTSALKKLEQHITPSRICVFTDDIQWVRRHLDLGRPFELISGNENQTALQDFHAMTLCSHHIIANSSFSWWSAWLSSNPNKIVIAPEKWFNEGPTDTQDLLPKGWITA